MSDDPVGEPIRRAHGDMLGRLAAIDHRLHQISIQLATMGKLLSQLDEIRANLETLIGSLESGGSIVNGRVPSGSAQ
jgi:flagellin-like hook-associated protein FlgL